MSNMTELHFGMMLLPASPPPAPLPAPIEERKTTIQVVPEVLVGEVMPAVTQGDQPAKKKNPTWVTGFCGTGAHEGTKKLSARGALLKPCQGTFYVQFKTYECNCSCHAVFREIAAITGVTTSVAQTVGSSSVTPPVVPTGDENPVPLPSGTLTRPIGQTESRPVVTTAPTFSPTNGGHRPKGGLESEVAYIAFNWFNKSTDPAVIGLTPDLVIRATRGDKKPSNGAVYAVFKRWERQGYVTLANKPFRMVKLTESGLRYLARWA
jgi:hypothetical protein